VLPVFQFEDRKDLGAQIGRYNIAMEGEKLFMHEIHTIDRS